MPESEARESRRTAESGGRTTRRVRRPEPSSPGEAETRQRGSQRAEPPPAPEPVDRQPTATEPAAPQAADPEAVDPGVVDVEPVGVEAEGEAECSHPAEARDYQSGTCAACGAILWD